MLLACLENPRLILTLMLATPFNNRLKAEAKDLLRNKPSIKPEAAGRGFYARFISR